jgi:hypothetical protein
MKGAYDCTVTSQPDVSPSIAEVCASVKRLGYGINQSIRLYGEEFEVTSDPFPESGGIAVNVRTKKSDGIRVVQLPATVLQSVRGARLPDLNSDTFIVLRFVNTTPSLACCTKSQSKFFTPNSYYNDPVATEPYLHTKYDLHRCFVKRH